MRSLRRGVTGFGLAVFLILGSTKGGPVAAEPAGTGKTGTEVVQRQGPLAGLPSRPGAHVEKIKALGDNAWLVLGVPTPDPEWGKARGRSWGAKMAFAPDLGGAFLFGEGVHGWWNRKTGRYMDDLWFYDLNAHRWVCVHPGTDVNAYGNLIINEDGFEATPDGAPVPVASMVHGYEMITYDTHRKRFMSMPCPGAYWKAIKGRRERRAANPVNERLASPWFYDTVKGRWARLRTSTPRPSSSFGDTLIYLPAHKRALFYRRGLEPHFYDPEKNVWTRVKAKGPKPPFGIDATSCYDPKRDRIYIGGGSYPVAKGDNALWVYDLKTDSWIDPQPKGKPCGGSNSYNTNVSMMHYDTANDMVVVVRHQGSAAEKGIWIYDPEKNEWTRATEALPKAWGRRPGNAFYDPGLNVHIFHAAGDSRDDGIILAYRFRRARP